MLSMYNSSTDQLVKCIHFILTHGVWDCSSRAVAIFFYQKRECRHDFIKNNLNIWSCNLQGNTFYIQIAYLSVLAGIQKHEVLLQWSWPSTSFACILVQIWKCLLEHLGQIQQNFCTCCKKQSMQPKYVKRSVEKPKNKKK